MDAFGEIGVFTKVVEARSFTRAATQTGLTASGVSRIVSRLEARLGVRLLERSTRSVGLTADGAAYYERCARILRDLEDADGELARSRGVARGRLRVDAPTSMGRFLLAPAIPKFLAENPELALDLSLRDHLVDPIGEGLDVVLRMATLRESELVQKRLGAMRFHIVASPEYLARHGRPEVPADIQNHQILGFLAGSQLLPWRFRQRGRDVTFQPTGRLNTNSHDAVRHAALAGLGLARMLDAHVRDDVARGKLEIVLRDHEPGELPIHALFTREKANHPKVRAFLSFLERLLRPPRRA